MYKNLRDILKELWDCARDTKHWKNGDKDFTCLLAEKEIRELLHNQNSMCKGCGSLLKSPKEKCPNCKSIIKYRKLMCECGWVAEDTKDFFRHLETHNKKQDNFAV